MTIRDVTLSAEESPDLTGRDVAATLDAGEQNCATLILSVRKAIQELAGNEVLAVVAYDPSAQLDLHAWCRMTGHRYLGSEAHDGCTMYFLEKTGD